MCFQAADLGHAPAQHSYVEGKVIDSFFGGVGALVHKKDYSKAIPWYKRAAIQGYPPAQFKLAECLKEAAEKLEWCKKAAIQEYIPAQSALAKGLRHNAYGVPIKEEEAFEFFRKLAVEEELPAGKFEFGFRYKSGNDQLKWYREASIGGHVEASYILGGISYEKFERNHNEKDLKEAIERYWQAALLDPNSTYGGISRVKLSDIVKKLLRGIIQESKNEKRSQSNEEEEVTQSKSISSPY